jgi:hypothetical protein
MTEIKTDSLFGIMNSEEIRFITEPMKLDQKQVCVLGGR